VEESFAIARRNEEDTDCGADIREPCDGEYDPRTRLAFRGKEGAEQDEGIRRDRRNDVLDGSADTDDEIDEERRQIGEGTEQRFDVEPPVFAIRSLS
jgi:hypothetical protein